MRWGAAWLAAWALLALLDGCGAVTPQDAVMQGNANGVVINYVGDLNPTVPLAQQYCARFERVPVLHETKEGNAYYFCVPPSAAPH
jgi:hypothetical protein